MVTCALNLHLWSVTCDLRFVTADLRVYLTWFDCKQKVLSFWYCKNAQNAFKRKAILFCHISQVNIISPSYHWSESSWWYLFSAIHHFHEDHNAAYLTPQIFIIIVFDFCREDCNTQEKLETTVMQNLGGKQGKLWSMRKWWMAAIFPAILNKVMHANIISSLYLPFETRTLLKSAFSLACLETRHETSSWLILHETGFTR